MGSLKKLAALSVIFSISRVLMVVYVIDLLDVSSAHKNTSTQSYCPPYFHVNM